jgi:transcriptional regulator with XRE-family HTH domain
LEQLVASGDGTEPVPLGVYLEVRQLLHSLKHQREAAGLSLADVADRTGIDKAALSRLENGHQPNPTVETLYRYARGIGKQLAWTFRDAAPEDNEVAPTKP